jgi:acyl-CoA synthetase (NDP forming)
MELAGTFLEENRVPCYEFPEMAVRVLARMRKYARLREEREI